jgi:predicted transcriptional regulator
MQEYQLGVVERRFADMIWENAPISSAELTVKARDSLGWKKSTTYTVLKRLCEKGLFSNEGGKVCVVIPKEEFSAVQSQRFVEQAFDGSLPAFLAAFARCKPLTREEVEQLRRMVDAYGEE